MRIRKRKYLLGDAVKNWERYIGRFGFADSIRLLFIGIEMHEGEIEKMAIEFGLSRSQIIPPVYVVSQIIKWRKIYTLQNWKRNIENENITVMKNWYYNNDKFECVLKISNAWNEIINIKTLSAKKSK